MVRIVALFAVTLFIRDPGKVNRLETKVKTIGEKAERVAICQS